VYLLRLQVGSGLPIVRGMKLFALSFAVLALACGAAPEWPRVAVTTSDPTLAALLQGADARWEQAGADADGVTIADEPGALEAAWLPDDAAMREVCSHNVIPAEPDASLSGCVEVDREGMPVAVWFNRADTAAELPRVVTHEMGHLLGIQHHLAAPALMAAEHGSDTITEADLAAVCAAGRCGGETQ